MLWRNDWCSGCCCNAQLVVRVERGWSWHFFCPRRNESPYSHRDNSWVKNMFSNCLGEKRCSSPPEKRRATPEDGLPVGSGVSPTEQGLLCACGLEKENASIVQHLWIIQYRLGLIVQLSRKLVSNLSRHLVHMGHLEKNAKAVPGSWWQVHLGWPCNSISLMPTTTTSTNFGTYWSKQCLSMLQCSANSSSLQAIAIAQGLEIGFVRFVASAWQQKNLRKKGTKNGAEVSKIILPSSIGNLL